MKVLQTPPSLPELPPLLSVGDIAPDCILSDAEGKEVNLRSDSIAGNPIVIIFCPRMSPTTKETLIAFSYHLDLFQENGARLFVVTMDKADEALSRNLDVPVLSDRHGSVYLRYTAPRDRLSTIVLRRNHHVAGILSGEAKTQASDALSLVKGMAWERTTEFMNMHPPVLLVPGAFSRDDCAKLIDIFNTRGQTFFHPNKPALDYFNGADYKMRIPEHMREDRIDHFFFEKDTVAFLVNRLNRVLPEIFKAFQYRITKYESLRMACYHGQRGGYGHGHRDNIPPHLHRRFAMSINLNTQEFEGGELRFPEFGDQRYRPEAGTAIVFSSSLLHEAMHVTAGRRFVFLAFLFGEH
jgi:peroxiredoxin